MKKRNLVFIFLITLLMPLFSMVTVSAADATTHADNCNCKEDCKLCETFCSDGECHCTEIKIGIVVLILLLLIISLIIFLILSKKKEEKHIEDNHYAATFNQMTREELRQRKEEEHLEAKSLGLDGGEDFVLQLAEKIIETDGKELALDFTTDEKTHKGPGVDIALDFPKEDPFWKNLDKPKEAKELDAPHLQKMLDKLEEISAETVDEKVVDEDQNDSQNIAPSKEENDDIKEENIKQEEKTSKEDLINNEELMNEIREAMENDYDASLKHDDSDAIFVDEVEIKPIEGTEKKKEWFEATEDSTNEVHYVGDYAPLDDKKDENELDSEEQNSEVEVEAIEEIVEDDENNAIIDAIEIQEHENEDK